MPPAARPYRRPFTTERALEEVDRCSGSQFDPTVAEAFLATTQGFVPLHAGQATSRLAETLVDRRGHLRTQPHVHGLEAFFGAVFEREM